MSTNTPMWVETLSSLASQSQSEQTEQKVPANFIRATQQSFAFAATQVLILLISNYKKKFMDFLKELYKIYELKKCAAFYHSYVQNIAYKDI